MQATNRELRMSIQKPKALLVAKKRDHAAVWSSYKQGAMFSSGISCGMVKTIIRIA
jgi:hypothetical protein